jgi:hypothetical protein
MALFTGIAGAGAVLCAPAFAAVLRAPKITVTQATFAIPSQNGSTWTLRLWSHGTLEGSANATSGMLTVPVPATSDCSFQADVTVVPPGGARFFYSGTRAVVPGCGPPSTIAGDIFLCSAAGAPTATEVSGGTLAVAGPQTLPSQSNPVTSTAVASGSYTMTATSPSGYVVVSCGGSATIGSSGTTASETVVVPSGGAGVGTFYVVVAAPTGSLSGGSGPAGTASGAGTLTSPGNSGSVTAVAQRSKPAATPVRSSGLAFTGAETAPLLLTGLLALALGALATGLARGRRRRQLSVRSSRH